jgi:hypothetical protein
LAGFVIFSAVLTFLLLGTNVFEYLVTLFAQASSLSLSAGEFSLFPWTLVPSYLPMIFGLHTFGEIGRDPLLSLQIAAGFVLAGYALRCVWRSAVRDLPAGYLGLVIIGLGLSLFFKKYDFGLFKLAMYAQPILALCFAQDLSRFLFNQSLNVRRAARWGLAAFVVCTVPAAYNYTHSSLGDKGGGLAEIVDASRVGVKFAPPKDLPYDSICSDINNLVAAKMLMLYTKNIETYFLSRDYATNLSSFRPPAFLCDKSSGGLAMNDTFLLRLFFPENFLQSQVPFYLPPKIVAADNEWLDLGPHDQGRHLFVALRSDLDGFNKSNPDGGWRVDNIYQYKLESLLQNRLVFIHSKLGPQYFLSDRARVAIYQREPDPAMPGTASYHGTGRFNVFEVVNPTPSFRMVVDFTCSSLGAEACQLPEHAAVEGAGKYPLAFVGDGSARVISPPLQPEFLHDNAYLTVDFGREGRPFTTQKTGLMRLYGVAKNLDNRRLVGDTRDISLLTEEQYRALTRPTMISRFPDDLYRYPGLEYSGLSEDGWIAGEAYVKLGPSHPGQTLVFRGLIPAVPKFANHGVDLSLLINGTLSGTVHLMPGEFSLSRPLVEKSDITSVAFHFSDAQKYEFKLDRRRFSALVREIAIKDAAEVSAQAHRSGPSGEAPERSGLDSDGWLDRTAVLKTPVFPGFKVLKIDLEMPGWAPIASNGLKVFLNGRLIQADLVPRGSDQSLYLPIAAGAPAEVRLESATAFVLPKEYRERCFLVKNLSYEEPTRADLFARGWHKSGYAFSIDRADTDGWVDRRVAFRFPATTQYKSAIVDVVRFPAPSNLPLAVSIDGAIAVNHPLGLEQAARIRIPLSAQTETTATLATERSFPLAAPDSRQRSFRITGIDFE